MKMMSVFLPYTFEKNKKTIMTLQAKKKKKSVTKLIILKLL